MLAANGILYQFFILSALILDGFESAAQVLCGEAVGARDRALFDRLVRALLALGPRLRRRRSSLVYALAGVPLAASFSTDPAVAAATLAYLPWAVLLPLAGVTAYVFDGVYIGATWTRALLAPWPPPSRSTARCCSSPARSAITACGSPSPCS